MTRLIALTSAHAQAMADIHTECFETPWPALDMSVHVARDLCLGSVDAAGTLQSFAILRPSDIDAELLTIATAKPARGQGLAGRVLTRAHQDLAQTGLRHVFLEVAEDNAPARALYARLGYQPIGRRPAYYRRANGRMAAITYSRALQQTPSSG